MRRETLRELLNRLRWSPTEDEEEATVGVTVRRAGREVEDVVALAAVGEIGPGGVVLLDGTFLPYHRVTRVTVGGLDVWSSPRGRDR